MVTSDETVIQWRNTFKYDRSEKPDVRLCAVSKQMETGESSVRSWTNDTVNLFLLNLMYIDIIWNC